ncbi:CvpA family protein [Schinkia sp. CFF1]
MIDLILLFVLVIGFFIGFRRGFVLQIVYFVGFIAAFIVAYLYSDDVAPFLKIWIPLPAPSKESAVSILFDNFDLEAVFYRVIAFAVLFFGTKIIMHFIGSMLNFLVDLPILRTINGWLGGALGFVEVYLVLFVLLFVGALTPIDSVQVMVNDSLLAKGMIEHTPIVSEKLKELWFHSGTGTTYF